MFFSNLKLKMGPSHVFSPNLKLKMGQGHVFPTSS